MVKLSAPAAYGLAGGVLIHTVLSLISLGFIVLGQHIVEIVSHPELVFLTEIIIKRIRHPSAVSRIKPSCIAVKTYKVACITHSVHKCIADLGCLCCARADSVLCGAALIIKIYGVLKLLALYVINKAFCLFLSLGNALCLRVIIGTNVKTYLASLSIEILKVVVLSVASRVELNARSDDNVIKACILNLLEVDSVLVLGYIKTLGNHLTCSRHGLLITSVIACLECSRRNFNCAKHCNERRQHQ